MQIDALTAEPRNERGAAVPEPHSPAGASVVRNPLATQRSAADEIESLYLTHRRLLLYVGNRKFSVPEGDAEALMQEVFVAYMQSASRIENVRAWLVAAMCNASRHYWRVHSRTESLPENFSERSDPASDGFADAWAMRMTLQKAIQYLRPRCQETLRLHYYEGRSAGDVARELDTTRRYAEKLIHNCLKRVREIFATMGRLGR